MHDWIGLDLHQKVRKPRSVHVRPVLAFLKRSQIKSQCTVTRVHVRVCKITVVHVT